MYKIDDININGYSGDVIDNFYFVETKQLGFNSGFITLNKILNKVEIEQLILNDNIQFNLYDGKIFIEDVKILENKNKTIIYINNNYLYADKYDQTTTGVTYTSTELSTVIADTLLKNSNMVLSKIEYNQTYPLFTGGVVPRGHGYNILQTLAFLLDNPKMEVDLQGNLTITTYEKRFFHLYQQDLSAYSELTSTIISEIENYQPDIFLQENSFDLLEKEIFNYKGNVFYHIRGATSLDYYHKYTITTTNKQVITYFPTPILDNTTDEYFFKKYRLFLDCVYYAFRGKIYAEDLHLEVGQAISYMEWSGLITQIVRTPKYDEIYVGYPEFQFPQKEIQKLGEMFT